MKLDDRLRELSDGCPLDVDTALRAVRTEWRRRRRRRFVPLAVTIAAALLIGALVVRHDPQQAVTAIPAGFVKSDVARATDPALGSDLVHTVVEGDSAFGLALLAQLTNDANTNVFFSPYSI